MQGSCDTLRHAYVAFLLIGHSASTLVILCAQDALRASSRPHGGHQEDDGLAWANSTSEMRARAAAQRKAREDAYKQRAEEFRQTTQVWLQLSPYPLRMRCVTVLQAVCKCVPHAWTLAVRGGMREQATHSRCAHARPGAYHCPCAAAARTAL